MHVVLSTNFSPWSRYSGGGQRSTHNLGLALARRGHEVTVVYTKPPWERVEAPPELPYRLRWAALVSGRSRRDAPLRVLTAISVAQAVRAELESGQQPIAVHCNGEEGALLPRLRRRRRFALVVTPRFPSLPDVLVAGGPRTLVDRARLLLLDPKYVALGRALKGADFCAPPSRWAGRLIERAYGLDPECIRPVHNGVPAEFLDYEWQPAGEARPIVFFGRLDASKGVDTLLDALAALDAPPAALFGRGPERERYVRRIADLGLGERVELHDWADHRALGQRLSQASMAVLPSREENFSLAVLAALAVGTPLVTTAVGGTPEVVEHERTGLLVPAGDAGALARAIARLRDQPSLGAELGRRGRDRVRREFTWDAAAQAFEGLYEAALGDARRSSAPRA